MNALVGNILPQFRMITVEELISWNEKIEVTRNVQDDNMEDAIVNLDVKREADTTTGDVESDPTTRLGSVQV